MVDENRKNIIENDGVYSCPECGSKRITVKMQCALMKECDANSNRQIRPNSKNGKMTNKEKAHAYDCACLDGVGCWNYECRRCGWFSPIYTE